MKSPTVGVDQLSHLTLFISVKRCEWEGRSSQAQSLSLGKAERSAPSYTGLTLLPGSLLEILQDVVSVSVCLGLALCGDPVA